MASLPSTHPNDYFLVLLLYDLDHVEKCWKILENKGITILLSKMCEGNETVGKTKLCGK